MHGLSIITLRLIEYTTNLGLCKEEVTVLTKPLKLWLPKTPFRKILTFYTMCSNIPLLFYVEEKSVKNSNVKGLLNDIYSLAEDHAQKPKEWENSALLTSYNWLGPKDGSLLVFEKDGTFKYYKSADDLTNYYFEGTYLFYIGAKAVTYVTTTLSNYGVTPEKLSTLFTNNKAYNEANFIIYVINNEACMIDGKNTINNPYQNPYMGFCLEDSGTIYLDVANMNTANYSLYVAKEK